MNASSPSIPSAHLGANEERFVVDIGDTPLSAVAPGRFGRGLYAATGIPGDAIQWLMPATRGHLVVGLSDSAARRLATPLTVPLPPTPTLAAAVVTVRRETDPPELIGGAFELTWADGDVAPSIGATAVAIASLSGGPALSEALELCVPNGGAIRLHLGPAAIALAASTELVIAGRAMTLTRLGR